MLTRGFLIGIIFHRYNAERTEVISENTWSDRLLFPNTLPNFLYDLIVTGFRPSTFVTALFYQRLFLYCFLSSVALWGVSMVGTERKNFEF